MEFCKLTEKEYKVFRDAHPYRTFLNSVEALRLRAQSGRVEFLGVKDGGVVVAATPVVIAPAARIYEYWYAQRGFLIDYRNDRLMGFFTAELKKYAKANKAMYLRVDPYIRRRARDINGDTVEGGEDNSDIIDIMKRAGFIHESDKPGLNNVTQSRWMFSLYINGRTAEELYKQFDEQTRWSINKTVKQGIEVRELGIDEIDIYTRMMAETAVRRGFPARTADFYRRFMEVYGDHAKLLLAYLDIGTFRSRLKEARSGLDDDLAEINRKLESTPNNKKLLNKKRVTKEAVAVNERNMRRADELEREHGAILNMATSCFTVYDNEVLYLFSGTDDTYRGFNGPYAIQWYMIKYAVEHGIDRYNFYGISGDFSENAVDRGVYEFKKGFGGEVEELLGDFLLPVAGAPFALYRRLKPELI